MAALSLLLPVFSFADELDDAKKRVNEFFKNGVFTAKIDIEDANGYAVTPDGRPPANNKRKGNKEGTLAFRAGDQGRGISIGVNKRLKLVQVTLKKKRTFFAWRVASVSIVFPRPVTPADLDPRVIARALVAFVRFDGIEVGQAFGAALDRLDSAEVNGADLPARPPPPRAVQAPDPVPPPNVAPTIISLAVIATPPSVRAGTDASLDLEYEVRGPAQGTVAVTLRRTLTFLGGVLPGYPVENDELQTAGRYTNRYRQPIPGSARPGVYEYRGEVCVGGDCISRTTTFTVTR